MMPESEMCQQGIAFETELCEPGRTELTMARFACELAHGHQGPHMHRGATTCEDKSRECELWHAQIPTAVFTFKMVWEKENALSPPKNS